jgi:hypothetical protein
VYAKFTVCLNLKGFEVGSSVQADTKFLRRVLLGLVLLTLATGAMAAVTTVQAMSDGTGTCVLFCQ